MPPEPVPASAFARWLGVEYTWDAQAQQVTATGVLTEAQEGPPRYVHGGVLTAILDEAMGKAAWLHGHPVVAANLNVDFRQPVPLGASVVVMAWVSGVDGRKISTAARLTLPDGALAVEGRGLFIEAPHLFGEAVG